MTVCDRCGVEIQIGEHPFCPHGFGSMVVVGDECDIYIKHGICHADGSPKRYRSKSEIAKAAKAKGLTNYVEHVGRPGSDKNPHTQRFI